MHLPTSSKSVFLLDAAGALLSAVLLGLLLPALESWIGLPQPVLTGLAAVAGVFSVYSFGCYLWAGHRWRPFLTAIALANLSYCLLTIGVIAYHFQSITGLGMLYFVSEIIILIVLIGIEYRCIRRGAA